MLLFRFDHGRLLRKMVAGTNEQGIVIGLDSHDDLENGLVSGKSLVFVFPLHLLLQAFLDAGHRVKISLRDWDLPNAVRIRA